ncbi:MAG: aminotransferase class I/II-fold pyridoxal phosphate-dependent enzyme [Conexibacter sp.]|nr:aminotransferase class I/II-fold pyridoxal phosphate-dependent enzyme [Conexibacter sp.]
MLPPPAHAIAALRAAALETATPVVHGYPPFGGHADLKAAIAERYAADHGVALDPDREVAVIPGTKTGIMLACLAAAEAGDAILLPDPGYPDYLSGAALAGAKVAPLPLEASAGFQPDFDAVSATAALTVLNYPSNPTAACEQAGTFEAAVAFAHERGGWVLNDLAYGFLAFDGRRARSILEVDGARDVALELWSPSKIYGMAGWRIGFAVGSPALVARIQELIDHTTAGVFTALQRGLAAALRSDQADVAERREVYRGRRDALVDTLAAAGADLAPAAGSFFVWWRLPPGLTPQRLIDEARVGVAPGEGFGARGAGWARLSLATPDADLVEAADRLARALRTST